jgi:hypothetical protein
MFRFTILLAVSFVLLAVLNFISYYLYSMLLLEIEGVFFADGVVSDVMQSTEISYVYIYQLRMSLLAGNLVAFDSAYVSAEYIHDYAYSLSSYNFEHFGSASSMFSQKRFYNYVEEPAEWRLQSQTASVDTYQFLENMYYLTGKMTQQLQQLRASNSTAINLTNLQSIASNFREMETLNEHFLGEYQSSAEASSSTLNYLTIASMVAFLVMSLVNGLLVDNYRRFRFEQAEASFRFFTFIPNQLIEKMKDYYMTVRQQVVEKELLVEVDRHEDEVFAIDSQEVSKVEDGRFSSFSKVKLINYDKYYGWVIILAFVVA